MKNNLLKNALLISGISIGLAACGGESSSNNSSSNVSDNTNNTSDASNSENVSNENGSSNDVLKFSIIDDPYNTSTRSEYAERTDYELRDGQSITINSVIKGSNEGAVEDTSSSIYLAPNFYAINPEEESKWNELVGKTVDVLSDKDRAFTYFISGTNGKKLTFLLEQKVIDIKGVTVDDKTKYATPLDDFKLINSRFPDGSLCYAYSKEKPSFSHFWFYDDNPSNYKTLSEWVEKTKVNVEGFVKAQYVNVGNNNEYKSVYLETTNGMKDTGSYTAAVSYNGKVYDAEYELESGYFPNVNVANGTVECDIVNDVAADYLEKEIKRYGKLDSF